MVFAAWEKLTEIRANPELYAYAETAAVGSGGVRIGEAGGPEDSGGVTLYTVEKAEPRFEIEVDDGVYSLTGRWLKKLVADTNFKDHESLQYFQTMLKKYGIIDALESHGIEEGETVKIYDIEFDFIR